MPPPAGATARMERHQIAGYVAALSAGAALGWSFPAVGSGLEGVINPVLGALLYVTFLQVPACELLRSWRDTRFLTATMVVNFVAVPLLVATMFAFLPAGHAVRVGVLLVLLAPCVDYVIVFTGLAGGSRQRLLAATPLLLIAQMLLLPVFLYFFFGPELVHIVDAEPFVTAFLGLIIAPLLLAWGTQAWAARSRIGEKISTAAGTGMVPLMAVTLLAVAASQIPKLGGNLTEVAAVIPFYVTFLVVMAFIGRGIARLFRMDTADSRAIVFTGATRNSLVVLPLALALPDQLGPAAIVVVTQTLVEVLGMVAYIRLIPRLVKP